MQMISTAPRSRRPHRLVASTAAGAAALALVLAGCASSQTASPAAAPTSAKAAPTASAATSSSAAASSSGTEVKVTMTEFALQLSQQSFSPGTYTFTADNAGKFPHTITIKGPGVENQSAGGPLQGGQSGALTVDLQPGTYEIWCPVGEHKAKGMDTTITVA
jgi:plastocyanin